MSTTLRRSLRHALVLQVAALVAGLVVIVSPGSTGSARAATMSQGYRVVQIAASRKGAPYKWGAEGPRRFDCSGLTHWVFAHAGRRIPRLSRDQYRASRHVRRTSRRVGDLVFFHRGRRIRSIYHVGIYAGHGMMWNAPHTGARVRLERVYSSRAWYGRVG